ncbi:RNA polymerase 2, chloroplastic/mitochondrial [Seminavis robusta]|uniref:DNA-directed RNA polymerase n=1 Tax=Seminavis robusta TaxID=568900 RepID=A0A9N8E247_9STRA|nr:RNA polymerase 2, chloroplastic/mitochondrial [Seminavis robusta]|eukprot:Sro453_g146140.1 RNA polymerase 2, chloroplastic/mitochondrial (1211) ;mRNA; r:33244-36965
MHKSVSQFHLLSRRQWARRSRNPVIWRHSRRHSSVVPWKTSRLEHHRQFPQYYQYHRALLSTAVASQPPDDDEDDELDEEIEALAASCFPLDDGEDDYLMKDDIRHLREQRRRMDHASLDLELGDTSSWEQQQQDVILESDDEEDDNHEFGMDPFDFPSFPEGSPAAELDRQNRQLQSESPQRYQPVLSPLDMLERIIDNNNSNNNEETTFDPLSYSGPPQHHAHQHAHLTKEQRLRQLQLQLECEAQQEAVQKYQKMTQLTRSRKDYASLNSLQKLILHWYQPIRDEIQATQLGYIFRGDIQQQQQQQQQQQSVQNSNKQKQTQTQETINDDDDDENDDDNDNNNNIRPNRTAIHRYGPLLNTVEPEKLAVILTHETLTQIIAKTQEQMNYGGGISLVDLAMKLGRSVEQEVLLQRILKQKMQEERQKQEEEQQNKNKNDAVAAFAKETLGRTSSKDSTTTKTAQPFSYTESRLLSYLRELAPDDQNAKNARMVAYAVRRARRALNADEWSMRDRAQVGTILLKILLDHATIRLPDGSVQPAFRMERRWNHSAKRIKSTNYILVHDALWKLAVADEFESIAAQTTRHKPMVIPPEPWTSPQQGGYAWLKTDLVRFHGSKLQREALDEADLTPVLDGLNALSREPWVINKTVLNVAQQCWDRNVPLGDIPSRTDLVVPPEPTPPERTKFKSSDDPDFDEAYVEQKKKEWAKEFNSFKEARNRYRRVQQKNRDLFSLRCSAMLKLGQAKQFQDYDSIYFPYNLDFRGRAYPIPPHFSNVGSDLCRGVLKFAKAKPLGKRGLFWLHVHVANLAGKDKMTFDDRAQYSMDNLENIRKSVQDPLGENDESGERPWWMSLDDPFQGLATCHEIVNAIDSGNPETYMCSLPVHMDGSCNGLQHYAALGRDIVGGTAVNLCNYDEPQDVYIGVMEEVIRRVAEEAEREIEYDVDNPELSKKERKEILHNKSAKLVNGLIDRGVVKRTVMTSVYGVTYIGARQQIQEKIEEKLEELGRDLDEVNYEVFAASGYLAQVTMEVIGDLFTGAKLTMNWLTKCARLLSAKGYPVAWMTPLGLPCIQPYRQKRTSKVVTALASVLIADFSDDLPIHKSRSVSAFPPNYIHSLDSTHMLMTAMEMDRRGLSFSAVHDSFWTHPCDVDEMNEALRDQFVELYSHPLLEELKTSFEIRYPDISFPDLPDKGSLDLEEVKESLFFFQ